MSNSVSHNLFYQSLLHPKVVDSRGKSKASGILGNSLFQAASVNQAALRTRGVTPSSSFYGRRLRIRKSKVSAEGSRPVAVIPRAVLAMEQPSELAGKFKLDHDAELQVFISSSPTAPVTNVNIQMTYTSDSLILHWGGIHDKREKWVLPARCPDGTKNHKNRALRTPFSKDGSSSFLKLEIDDRKIQAIEFLIFDEAKNRWFKNSGQNFHVKFPTREKFISSNVAVPEELVQVQAYLRWERNGKQTYTPQQEKASILGCFFFEEEYEAARAELLDEVARGSSIEDLRAKLNSKNNGIESKESPVSEAKSNIPEDLVQVQSYLRWERAGKPNYSTEQQQREFEEARAELQAELNSGVSLDEIRKKITKGNTHTKVSVKKEKYFTTERIQRKSRDLTQIVTKYKADSTVEVVPVEPQSPKPVELYANAVEEQDGYTILNKKKFKLGDKEILVLVSKPDGKIKVHVVTDLEESTILHWALAKNPGEWSAPPLSILPPDSVPQKEAAETPLTKPSAEFPYQVQSFQIEIEDNSFVGMPFVLLSNGNWIKNNGSDFYIEFASATKQVQKDVGDGRGTAKTLLGRIAEMEGEAQKSFMHRFNIASDLMHQAKDAGVLGIAAIFVWMRFMATRQLIWNKNYNVKPREISQAQDRLTDMLQDIYSSYPQYREFLRLILSTVGRGGEGDVGQRIRDEILVIQRNNDCKGGMMEEWHQKLHNNTSPDDVIICQALIDHISNDFDMSVYWKTLNDNGITKERLLSYDRAIHNEPSFRRDQKDGLLRDLGSYMRTLKAVHSGADLESAVANCMGYKAEGQGFMVGVNINPVSGLPSGFPELLQFVLKHVEDRNVEALLEGLLEARQELGPSVCNANSRLKDVLFLDIALDSAVRTAIERGYEELNDAGPEKIMYFITLVVENLALSSDDNEDLIYCLKGWHQALKMSNSRSGNWALYAKSILDRTRLALAGKAESYQDILQPSAEYLGSLLGVDQWAVDIFTEEVIRGGSAAALSSLLNRLDPVLRKTANLGSWQVICPAEAVGYVVVVDELLSVQNKTYDRPTILIAKRVKGEEEIPDGTVAVLTPDMPDVLSHVSVRARNGKVCFATCFDPNILDDLQACEGKLLRLKPTSAEVVYSEIKEDELESPSSTGLKDVDVSSLKLVKKQFTGKYAISSDEFTGEMVGAKSRNISYLRGKVPSWIGIPTSVALPFGVFEKVLSDDLNKDVDKKLQLLKEKLDGGEFDVLGEIRETVLHLLPPPELVKELKSKMQSSGMPWPGDEGENRWEQAWTAIKKVWASKWNERAYFSTKKIKLDHDYLCMAVLVQEIINADYAFVIHTTNPSSGDSSEIYAEVLGYPSKPIGLFIRRSIIFRSDSNGEDLEGYAGAGLYDSVPMDEEEKVVLDYSSDPLMIDENFQRSTLAKIASAGLAIEELYGSAQDIEGVVRDGKIFVVQTRPQV
ncbi:Alpha-glucan water dikinase, chloroplastic [Linum perenne]